MSQHLQLGKYRLYHHLATGGMGEVFLARHEGPAGFAKNVVVKRILPSVASDPAFVTMFLNEAKLAAMIEHPNVVQIFDLGLEGATYFIAMEYVHGKSLRQLRNALALRKQLISPELAARICSQALQGLHHAHTLTDDDGGLLQIVHRDVSPDNLLIGFNGVVKVVDFGIASAAVNVSTTRAGEVKGKYAYMAPEQLTSQKLDGRADVYAVGVLLYELLSGQRPFHATTEPGLIRAILQDELTPPCVPNPNVPAALNEVVMRAMARESTDRFASAEQMSLALEGYIQSTGKTVTNAHVGALMKEVFPDEAAQKTPTSYAGGVSPTGTPRSAVRVPTVTSAKLEESSLPDVEIVLDEKPWAQRKKQVTMIAAAIAGAFLLGGVAFTLPRASAKTQENQPATGIGQKQVAIAPAQIVAANAQAAANIGQKNAAVVANNVEQKNPQVIANNGEQKNPAVVANNGDQPAAQQGVGGSAQVGAKTELQQQVPPTQLAAVQKPLTQIAMKEPPQRHHAQKTARTEPKPLSERVEVASAEPAKPSKGRVLIRVNPWAEVFWGGRSMGVTPMDAMELPAGTQVLTLRNDNLKLEKKVSVTVVPDQDVVLKSDLLE